MVKDTLVLSTAAIAVPKMGSRPARTLLIAAAVLVVRHRFGCWSFDLNTDSTTVTDDPAETLVWLADRLHAADRLIVWRAEDVTVPSLIQAAEGLVDGTAAARLLRSAHSAFAGEIIDVAAAHGPDAGSFDRIAARHALPYRTMSPAALAEAHRTGNHGQLRDHVGTRAQTMWRLWLAEQPGADALTAATIAWLEDEEA